MRNVPDLFLSNGSTHSKDLGGAHRPQNDAFDGRVLNNREMAQPDALTRGGSRGRPPHLDPQAYAAAIAYAARVCGAAEVPPAVREAFECAASPAAGPQELIGPLRHAVGARAAPQMPARLALVDPRVSRRH